VNGRGVVLSNIVPGAVSVRKVFPAHEGTTQLSECTGRASDCDVVVTVTALNPSARSSDTRRYVTVLGGSLCLLSVAFSSMQGQESWTIN